MAGHIQDRGNGSYLLVYHIGYDEKGKRIRKTRTVKAKNKTEANKMLAAFVTEIDKGEFVAPSNTKFPAFVEEWKKDASRKLAPNTLEMYTYLLNGRMIAAFSHLKMESIKASYIEKYLNNLEEEGLSSSTIRKHYNLLSNIFKLAIKHDLINKNPMEMVDKPTVRHKAGQVYDSSELRELFVLLNKEENKQIALMVKMALKTGMRKGELLALQWDDVDFNNNLIHVRQSLSYTKDTGYQLKTPKTDDSVRQVAPPSKLMAELKRHIHKKRQEKMYVNELWDNTFGDLVFSTSGVGKENKKTLFGKPLHHDSPNRWWNRFLKRNDFKKIRWHDLRHTAATDLINRQHNIHSISKRLGHSSINITGKIYMHHLNEADQKIADDLDEDYI